MEVSALKHAGMPGIHGRSPLLRLQSDERLIALIRRGNHSAFEALVSRYEARLLAFCRHMLGSREDAEDVLQEVFAAAFNAIGADDRPINVRPWLYRIARNRSLNHLRRVQPVGVDSMDVHFADHGITTADRVHQREEFRELIGDVRTLPETQRTALLLREIDALSYEQISEAMDTTVPSVKSLLVRARVSLAEAAEARSLSCSEVRLELGGWAEGLSRVSAPVRRHLKGCDRCSTFRGQLKQTNKALAAVYPVGPLLVLKKLVLAHLGTSASAGGGAAATTAGTAAVGSGAGAGTGGLISAGVGALATKAAAGIAAAALVTAGAAEVRHVAVDRSGATPVAQRSATATPAATHHAATAVAPAVATAAAARRAAIERREAARLRAQAAAKRRAAAQAKAPTGPTGPATPATSTTAVTAPTPTPAPAVQSASDTTVLSGQTGPTGSTGTVGASGASGSAPTQSSSDTTVLPAPSGSGHTTGPAGPGAP